MSDQLTASELARFNQAARSGKYPPELLKALEAKGYRRVDEQAKNIDVLYNKRTGEAVVAYTRPAEKLELEEAMRVGSASFVERKAAAGNRVSSSAAAQHLYENNREDLLWVAGTLEKIRRDSREPVKSVVFTDMGGPRAEIAASVFRNASAYTFEGPGAKALLGTRPVQEAFVYVKGQYAGLTNPALAREVPGARFVDQRMSFFGDPNHGGASLVGDQRIGYDVSSSHTLTGGRDAAIELAKTGGKELVGAVKDVLTVVTGTAEAASVADSIKERTEELEKMAAKKLLPVMQDALAGKPLDKEKLNKVAEEVLIESAKNAGELAKDVVLGEVKPLYEAAQKLDAVRAAMLKFYDTIYERHDTLSRPENVVGAIAKTPYADQPIGSIAGLAPVARLSEAEKQAVKQELHFRSEFGLDRSVNPIQRNDAIKATGQTLGLLVDATVPPRFEHKTTPVEVLQASNKPPLNGMIVAPLGKDGKVHKEDAFFVPYEYFPKAAHGMHQVPNTSEHKRFSLVSDARGQVHAEPLVERAVARAPHAREAKEANGAHGAHGASAAGAHAPRRDFDDLVGQGGTGEITSRYGHRHAPAKGASTQHGGVDIRAREGTDIHAPAPGRVVRNFFDPKGGGNVVTLEHYDPTGKVTGYTQFLHQKDRSPLKEGQWVSRGDVIGHVGHTGVGSGAHLHYEEWKAKPGAQPLKLDGDSATIKDGYFKNQAERVNPEANALGFALTPAERAAKQQAMAAGKSESEALKSLPGSSYADAKTALDRQPAAREAFKQAVAELLGGAPNVFFAQPGIYKANVAAVLDGKVVLQTQKNQYVIVDAKDFATVPAPGENVAVRFALSTREGAPRADAKPLEERLAFVRPQAEQVVARADERIPLAEVSIDAKIEPMRR